MKKNNLMVLATSMMLAAAPLFAATKTTDFDVSAHSVNNLVAGGKVEITSLTKVEALTDGDILSESSFFFPAKPEQIVSEFSTPEGITKLATFCKGVVKTGATADGKGWTGEMTIDATKITKVAGKGEWIRDFKQATAVHGEYKINFELRVEQETGATAIRFALLNGRVLSKCELTVRVLTGGPASTMVVVQSRSNSKLAPTLADRVSLAKSIVRDSAAILDHAFSAN